MLENVNKEKPKSGRKPTGKLLSELFSTKSFAKFVKNNVEWLNPTSFPNYLAELCESRGILRRELCLKVEIERTFAHQIFTGRRRPPREFVLKLAFGLGLSVEECQRLLTVAKRNTLYPRIPRDAAILHCLHHKLDYDKTQEKLFEYDMSLLGEEALDASRRK
jgi:transcriptional regulator with XRE-family HTH domain